jgi:hypothetical protein
MVRALLAEGLSVAEASRRAGIPRSTVRTWLSEGLDQRLETRVDRPQTGEPCELCLYVRNLPEQPYAYLLGLYLGDGCIASHARGVYRLRIIQDQKYVNLIQQCKLAMHTVISTRVGLVQRQGCKEIVRIRSIGPACFLSMASGQSTNGGSCSSPGNAGSPWNATPTCCFEASSTPTDADTRIGSGRSTPTRATDSRTDRTTSASSSWRHAPDLTSDVGKEAHGDSPLLVGMTSRRWTPSLDQKPECPERDSNPHVLSDNCF